MKTIYKWGIGLGVTGAIAAPIAVSIANDSSSNSVYFQGRRTIVMHSDAKSFAGESNRAWDLSVQGKNLSSRDYYNATSSSLFRQTVTQSSKVTIGKDNVPKEIKKKTEQFEFDAINSVTVPGHATFNNYKDLEAHLGTAKTKEFKFTVNPGTKYINSKGQETKYNFHAIDLFYGFMRSIYSSEEVRDKGTIKGQNPVPAVAKDAAYLKRIKNSSEFYPKGSVDSAFNSQNVYLMNLYGFDLGGTIKANTGANSNPDEFTLKFSTKQDTSIIENFLGNNTMFQAVPSEKLLEMNGGFKDFDSNPGKFLQLLEFGAKNINNGDRNLDQELKITRFYMSSYNINPNTSGIVVEKNIHSYDKKWNKKADTILKYQILVDDAGDKDVLAQIRQKSFLEDNSESYLNGEVKENLSLMDPIEAKGYYTMQTSNTKGLISSVAFNPWFMINTSNASAKLDDNTAKLLFGDTADKAKSNPQSDVEWFSGRGREFRTLLNSSVNLYGLSAEWTPGSSAVKTTKFVTGGTTYMPGKTFKDIESDTDLKRIGLEHGTATDLEQMEYYLSNNKYEKNIFLKPTATTFTSVKARWTEFAKKARTDLGLAPSAQFVFPLYDMKAVDNIETSKTIKVYNEEIEQLNITAAGSGIKFVKFVPKGGKDVNAIDKLETAPVTYLGAGPDYDSALSMFQQMYSATYGIANVYALIKEALNNTTNPGKVSNYDSSDAKKNDWTIKEEDISGFIASIKLTDDEKTLIKKLTLSDWMGYKTTKDELYLDKTNPDKTHALFDKIDNAAQNYFFSIATNAAKVKMWTSLMVNSAVMDRLSLGYAAYTSKGSKANATLQYNKIYEYPWLHVAGKPSSGIAQFNLFDTTIDVKG